LALDLVQASARFNHTKGQAFHANDQSFTERMLAIRGWI
jgi:hypothetical protein